MPQRIVRYETHLIRCRLTACHSLFVLIPHCPAEPFVAIFKSMAITIRTSWTSPRPARTSSRTAGAAGKGRGRAGVQAGQRLSSPRATSRPRSRSWWRARQAGENDQVLLGVTGTGQDLHHGQGDRGAAAARRWSWRPTRSSRRSSMASSRASSRTMRSSISSATTTTTSPRPTCPRTDTYIEKESSVNEAIDRMRHSATRALLERDDVIIVASVSLPLRHRLGRDLFGDDLRRSRRAGRRSARDHPQAGRVAVQAQRPGLRARQLPGARRQSRDLPAHYEDTAWRISFFGDEIEEIVEFDPLTGKKARASTTCRSIPNTHYVTPGPDAQAGDGSDQA